MLIINYGARIYHFMNDLDNTMNIPVDFLDRHKINTDIRTKMIDWMVEVLAVYNCSNETFFLSVFILDFFIFKSPEIIKTEEIHCIGLTSMFIASKFEDLHPINMANILYKIGHNIFEEKQILSMEKKILETISFENLIRTSTNEFIKTYFYDFRHNNRQAVEDFNVEEDINKCENLAIYFSKLSCYSYYFYDYNCALKAVVSIIASFDSYRDTGRLIKNKQGDKFFSEWIFFLISESKYPEKIINDSYKRLIHMHKNYENIPLISCNLNKHYY